MGHILGLSFSHNASLCVLDEDTGEILYCSAEERFTRRKNEWGIPRNSIGYALKHVTRPELVTAIVVGELCTHHYATKQFCRLINFASLSEKDDVLVHKLKLLWIGATEILGRFFGKRVSMRDLLEEEIRALGLVCPVHYVEHHSVHAHGAYFFSESRDALIVTMDGEGDGASGTFWRGKNAQLSLLETVPDTESAGLFYKYITALLGFTPNKHEGKVMGLSASGNPDRFLPLMREMLRLDKNQSGNYKIQSRAAQSQLQAFSRKSTNFSYLFRNLYRILYATSWERLHTQLIAGRAKNLFSGTTLLSGEQDIRCKQDIAAAAQEALEECVVAIIQQQSKAADQKDLVLSGGLFANIKLNRRIMNTVKPRNFYVHPGMGDEGLALGAASKFFMDSSTRCSENAPPRNVYLGPSYDSRASLPEGLESLAEQVAQLLADGKIVGLFQGSAEYGPRALGNRSILASPLPKDMCRLLNERLERNDFMPFAPTVIEEYYDKMFSAEEGALAKKAAKYMTVNLQVKESMRDLLTAVVHIDGTARPQLLSQEDNPLFYEIIRAFQTLTGVGCVLNTSMNRHEEPIVQCPEEAFALLKDGSLDALVLDGSLYLLKGGEVALALDNGAALEARIHQSV